MKIASRSVVKVLASFLLLAVSTANAQDDELRPNVVVIISDDQGWSDIGYNNPSVYTPNLDQLANSGLKLVNHYVMPQCTPTRVALMTGRYPGRFGTNALRATNHPVFPLGTPTLASMFQEAGYETFMTGKWHLGASAQYGPNHFGFDQSHGSFTGAVGMYDHRYHAKSDTPFDPTWHRNHEIIPGYENGNHVTDLTCEEAVKFINRKREQPFFLYLPFHAPHTPLDERGQFSDTPTQPDSKDPSRWRNEDKITWFNDPDGKIQAEPSRDKRLLLAAVNHLDHAIGKVIEALETSGQKDNTIILFSSDNGPWVNSKGGVYPDDIPLKDYNQPRKLRGKKLDVWEGGIHVAGFIHWPKQVKKGELEQCVHIVDWFPTLANLIGYQSKKKINWDGVDLGPAIFAGQNLPDRDLYWIWNPKVNRWALRYKQWKIVKYGRGEPSVDQWQLFNLVNDPAEKHDLADQNGELVAMMHQRFLLQRSKDLPNVTMKQADD